jgi:hypothetical protein
MKKKKHLHTNFIKFLLERHLEDPDVDDEIERPIPDEELEELRLRKSRKLNEFDDEEDEELPFDEPQQEDSEDGENDEDTIDQLLTEYRKLKKQYESRRIPNRRKR